MESHNELICAVLLGITSTEQEARHIADMTRNCPYASYYTSDDKLVVGIYVLPETKQWWAEVPEGNPELVGLTHALVFISGQVFISSPWSRDEVKPVLSEAPCLADCLECPYYMTKCNGCPATIHYHQVPSG